MLLYCMLVMLIVVVFLIVCWVFNEWVIDVYVMFYGDMIGNEIKCKLIIVLISKFFWGLVLKMSMS